MKKFLFVAFLICGGFLQNQSFAQEHFKVRSDDFIHIGRGVQKSLTFGNQNSITPDNGLYGIETFNGGLNFWKPWPNPVSYGNYVLYLRPDQNIGIGTMGVSNYKLDVAGKIRCTHLQQTMSDARFKTEVATIGDGLQKILALEGVSYQFTPPSPNLGEEETDLSELSEVKRKTIEGQKKEQDTEFQFGLIAQEVQKVIPELVSADDNGYLSLNYSGLIPFLIEATKSQQKQIEELRKEVERLKNK